MIMDNNFKDFKEKTITKLNYALKNNLVDKEVINILNSINSNEKYVTTSSCAGRIVIMEIPKVGDKKNAVFHGKWHSTVSIDEINLAIKKYETGQLWFITQPPIFHIASENLKDADKLLKIGIKCGFKHSGFKTVNERIIVELCSTERIDMLVGLKNEVFVNKNTISNLMDISNDLMIRSQKKLKKLEKTLLKLE